MELTEDDIASFEVACKKMQTELQLTKEKLKETTAELITFKINSNELECKLAHKNKLVNELKAAMTNKNRYFETLEREVITANDENQSLKFELQTRDKTNQHFKKLLQASEIQKAEILNRNRKLESQIAECHSLKTGLVTEHSHLKEEVKQMKLKLDEFKNELNLSLKSDVLSSNSGTTRAMLLLQKRLDDANKQNATLESKYCYFKALSEQLRDIIENDSNLEDIKFFYEKWNDNTKIIDEIYKYFSMHKDELVGLTQKVNIEEKE